MSEATGEEHAIITEGRAVLGPANLVRLGTLLTIVALAGSSVASVYALKSEIRDAFDDARSEIRASADSARLALAGAQGANALDVSALRADVQAMRNDMQNRTSDTVTRSEIRLMLERLARMNSNMDSGKGLNVPELGR